MTAKRNLPFEKGKTLYEGEVPTSGANYGFCGQEYTINDSTTGRETTLRAVRNESGITLYGRLPVQLNIYGTSITGYATSAVQQCCIIDDDLGSSGVEDDDVCYVVVKGSPLVKTGQAGLSSIVAGDWVTALTQANSTAAGTTGAGVNLVLPIANATDATAANINSRGIIGRAVSAATTNNTATAIRVNLDVRFV